MGRKNIYIKNHIFHLFSNFFLTEVFFNYALLNSLKILSLASVFAIFVPGDLRSPRRLYHYQKVQGSLNVFIIQLLKIF